jgi:hypothetical protein
LLLALCDQRATHAKAPQHHLANTDCQNTVPVLPMYAKEYMFIPISE